MSMSVHDPEPHGRPLRNLLLVSGRLQHCYAAVPVVSQVRSKVGALFAIAMVVNVGMWLERFVIVVTSLHRDFLPSSWGMYYPTRWDIATFVGTIGLFLALLFLFIRFLPLISIFEMRALVSEEKNPPSDFRLRGFACDDMKRPSDLRIDGGVHTPEQLLEAARRTQSAGIPPHRRVSRRSRLKVWRKQSDSTARGFR